MSAGQVDKVVVSEGVMTACWTHAFVTEKEEMMGLLVGSVNEEERVLTIRAMKLIRRLTKEKDRCEIDPQDLVAASEYAESLPGKLKVQGWYHSHPHITVQPSHVDLATQQNYQNMDKNFVGLIFSVFDVDFKRIEKFECQNYEVIAFQTRGGECHYLDLEVRPLDRDMEAVAGLAGLPALPALLAGEEREDWQKHQASDSCSNPVITFHNSAALTTNLMKQHCLVAGPLLEAARAKAAILRERIAQMNEVKAQLQSCLDDFDNVRKNLK